MQEAQDWCLHCGAGPGGRGGTLAGGPGWRTGAAILATTALLVAGASVAAYAALTKSKPKPKRVAVVVRQPTPTPTPTPTTPGTTPPVGATPGVPTTVTPSTPTPTPKPKGKEEPLFPPETKSTTKSTTSTKSTPTSTGAKETTGKEEKTEGGESQSGAEPPSPILLDTNAAAVYNPYGYPASLFGDPSLTIDGDAKTAWIVQVQPEKAPHMAEGLLLDLREPQKLGSATVKTSTTGATVEVYGANGAKPPPTIGDTAWKRLVGLKTLKKKETSFKLKTNGKPFRYVVLWLAKAPPGSTAAKPGRVAIDEFELFPPA
jgi:hypothetical protein